MSVTQMVQDDFTMKLLNDITLGFFKPLIPNIPKILAFKNT